MRNAPPVLALGEPLSMGITGGAESVEETMGLGDPIRGEVGVVEAGEGISSSSSSVRSKSGRSWPQTRQVTPSCPPSLAKGVPHREHNISVFADIRFGAPPVTCHHRHPWQELSFTLQTPRCPGYCPLQASICKGKMGNLAGNCLWRGDGRLSVGCNLAKKALRHSPNTRRGR